MVYDSLIIGGGIAGLQAAIQLGRYQHKVLVIDAGYGRSTLCRNYHNLLGWPDGVSGETLRDLGRVHAEKLGVQFMTDEVIAAKKHNDGFSLTLKNSIKSLTGRTLLFATGLLDRFPPLPGLIPCLGLSIYVCPDCDGYEARDKRTLILGAGDSGAGMALSLTYWTNDIIFINHERKPLSARMVEKLKEQKISYIEQPIGQIIEKEGKLQAVILDNGQQIEGTKAFIAFGGNEIKSGIAHQLGVERLENGHIVTDPRSKMTNIPQVWAAGDIGVHSEQVTIAMGEGSQAAIWMHKALLKMEKTKELAPV
jgi:thioredoxin reductase (NADPH)